MTELQSVIDTLDNAADSFDGIATKEQKKIYDEVITLAKDLDLDANGKVKQSIANLKRLTEIKARLAALSKDKEWVASISGFAKYFGVLQQQQNAYYTDHFPSLTLSKSAKQKHALMKQLAVQNTMEALMGSGLKANVTDKLNDILLRAVTTNARFADLQEELRAHLLGKDGGQGAFSRYATTYATTALSQFTGQNNKLLTDDLGCEWFMYTGSNKETSREFCIQLTAKKFIHKSEIPTILTGRIDDYQCAIYPKTGLPYGMIEGTTADNFQCNCGGWNCRHQLVPIADALVPASLRAKFAKGKPQKQETPAPNENTKQSIDLTPYQEQISAIEQYIADHPKSAKIKGYLESINSAADNGNETQLKALLQAAKKDIAKFNAAKKAIEKKKSAAQQQTASTPAPAPSVKIKNTYNTLQEVRDTISEVNKTSGWFNPQVGVGDLVVTTQKGINGSTNRFTGVISLTPEREKFIKSAMSKIGNGVYNTITEEEADAMATYWHEITHNRNHTNSLTGLTDAERKKNTPYMECANEYIARETMEEFYNALGCPIPDKAKPFMVTRWSTAYQENVEKLQNLIKVLQCNKQQMNSILQDKLFKGSYDNLKDGIATALYYSGGYNMVYDKKQKETQITEDDCTRMINWAIGMNKSLRILLQDINAKYPNLRRKQ